MKKTVIAMMAALCCLLGTVAASPAANASKIYDKSYKHTWTFSSSAIKRCLYITVSGDISWTNFKKKPPPRGGAPWYFWQNITLNDPTLHIQVVSEGPPGETCYVSKTLSKVNMVQHWKGYGCSFNPSIGVSAPFAISVSGWPSCSSNKTQGTYSTTPTAKRSHYTQSNSGSPLTFESYGKYITATSPCYGVFPSVVAYVGGNSDSFGAGSISNSYKICLPWH